VTAGAPSEIQQTDIVQRFAETRDQIRLVVI